MANAIGLSLSRKLTKAEILALTSSSIVDGRLYIASDDEGAIYLGRTKKVEGSPVNYIQPIGDVNKIEKIKVNGSEVEPTVDKVVDLGTITGTEYTIVKQDTAEEGYLSTYYLAKASATGTPVGAKINIPKDLVVKDAFLHTMENNVSEGEKYFASHGTTMYEITAEEDLVKGDKMIIMVINTEIGGTNASFIQIKATSLIPIYVGDDTYITVDASTHKISAKIGYIEGTTVNNGLVDYNVYYAAITTLQTAVNLKVSWADVTEGNGLSTTGNKLSMATAVCDTGTASTAGALSANDAHNLASCVSALTWD